MPQAELYDGTVLDFEEGTPDDVIARVARQQTDALRTAEARKPLPDGVRPSGVAGGRGVTNPSLASDQLEAGNIDMSNRPRVKNGDGSTSTVRSISANIDGREVLMPTVSDAGRVMSDEEAIDQYRKTGRHLGVFKTPEAATEYAQRLHDSEAAKLDQEQNAAPPSSQAAPRWNIGGRGGAPVKGPETFGAFMDKVPPRPGYSDAQIEEGSIEPERLKQLRKIREQNARGPQYLTALSPTQEAAANFRDFTDNPVARGAVTASVGVSNSLFGAVRLAADLAGLDTVAGIAGAASKEGDVFQSGAMQDMQGTKKLVADVTNSIGQSVPTLVVGLGGGPAMRALFTQTALSEYNTGRNSGFSMQDSLSRAGIMGAAEVLGERFGFTQQIKLLKGVVRDLPPGEMAKTFGELIRKEIPGEQLTTAIQFLADKAGPAAQSPNATLQDYLEQAGETLKVTIGQTAVMGGGPAAIVQGRDAMRQADAAVARSGLTQAERMAVDKWGANPYAIANARGFRVEPPLVSDDAKTQRSKTTAIFENTAAQYGIPPSAVARAKAAAEGIPAAQLGPFYSRFVQALQKRDLVGAPVDVHVLDSLEAGPVVLPEERAAQAGETKAAETGTEAAKTGTPAAAEPDYSGLSEPADQVPAPAPAAAGIDEAAHAAATSPQNDWAEFKPDTGTKGVPRAEMPQIKAGDRSALVQFLRARGVDYAAEAAVPAEDLKPTQAEFSPAKVAQAKGFTDTNRSILVSSDGYVLDGHHQWLAKLDDGEPVSVIRLDAPITKLLPLVREFPSATSDSYNKGHDETQNDQKPGVDSVAARATSVQRPELPRLPGVRREGDQDVPGVGGRLSAVPGGTGPQADAAALSGPDKGLSGVSAGQRPVGDKGAAVAEPAGVRQAPGVQRQDADSGRVVSRTGGAGNDAVRTDEPRFAGREDPAGRQDAARQQAQNAGTPGAVATTEKVGTRTRDGSVNDSTAAGTRLVGGRGADATRVIARVGITPKQAVPLELRTNPDGTHTPWLEGHELLDYDSGEPVRVPAGASTEEALTAVKAARALGPRQKFFPAETAKPTTTEAKGQPTDAAPPAAEAAPVEAPAPAPSIPAARPGVPTATGAGVQAAGVAPTAEPVAQSAGRARIERLMAVAKSLGVSVTESAGGWHATGDMVTIPDGDVDSQRDVSKAHVFAHELGHVVMKKRQLGFRGFPKSEVQRYISNWDDLVAASREFRPGVHNHANDRFRRHARKPDEIIADAIGAVLLGDKPVSLLAPMMEKLGLTQRDLGIEAAPAALAPAAAEAVPPAPPPTKESGKQEVSKNTIFTEDAAERARALLRKKLEQPGRPGTKKGQGGALDPEVFQAGITLTGYHIEKGARTFAAYAKAMIDDLGEVVRPYLKSWYAAVYYDPRAAALQTDMTPLGKLDETAAAAEEQGNVRDADTGVERDRGDAGNVEREVGEALSGRGLGEGPQTDGKRTGSARRGRPDNAGVPTGGASPLRELGDQPLRGSGRAAEPSLFDAGTDDGERSDDPGIPGVQPDPRPAGPAARPTAAWASATEKRAAQRAAESVKQEPGIDNIRATLPYLQPGQQDDVFKAEQRFSKPGGYGMLFTNGTGTGKTFSGLGIVKRFVRAGKRDVLIVVPDAKIMADWIESGTSLGLDIKALADTKDAGRGVTITTYANLGENDALAGRSWDLVVPDEVHMLMQSADGKQTKALDALRAITLHPRGVSDRFAMLNRDDVNTRRDLSDQIAKLEKDRLGTGAEQRKNLDAQIEALRQRYEPLNKKLKEARKRVEEDVAARQGEKRTRVAGLSATPFAYEKTVDWADGYLFDYDPDGAGAKEQASPGYNEGGAREKFFMQHFGYRMRYGKLTEPDSKVDRGLLQRQFNGWLKKQGVLSGRMLDVDADYDRRFILAESAVGNEIDRAIEWIRDQAKTSRIEKKDKEDAVDGWAFIEAELNDQLFGKTGHLVRRYLLEAIKAKEVIQHVRDHMAIGRKVVVFHDFKKGGSRNPFAFAQIDAPLRRPDHMDEEGFDKYKAVLEARNAAAAEFRNAFPNLAGDRLLAELVSPITRFKREFPGVLLINGDEKKPDLLARYKRFNDDDVGPQVALVQSAKNKGWSGHDTTGKHQRVLFNLGLPTQPTMSIQQEGRIYRTGQVSNAIFRYLNTGTNWERWAFAQTIAERASAAENLATGELARALKDAFIAGFEESGDFPAGHEGEGTGGKERDRLANEAVTEYDRAKAFYFGTAKKTAKTKAKEGTDYFATPEPVGLKMVQMLDLRGGEDALEPSAGHGAIARWFPETANRTAVEPSNTLGSRLAMVFDGKIIRGDFEDLNVVNKYDGIAMNPPFGTAGRTAIDHLAKAAEQHLREGGRIVALIPTGPAADKKFDKWFYEEEQRPLKPLFEHPTLGPVYRGDTLKTSAAWEPEARVVGKPVGAERGDVVMVRAPGYNYDTTVTVQSITEVNPTGPRTKSVRPAEGLHLVADIKLPAVTFERAGTQVMTRVVVIEKTKKDEQPPQQINRDYTDAKDINELFDRMEGLELKPRAGVQTGKEAQAPAAPAPAPRSAAKAEKAAATQQGEALAAATGAVLVEHTTQKGKLLKGVVRKDLTLAQAKEVDEYTFKKDGGFFIRAEHLAKLAEKYPDAQLDLGRDAAAAVAGGQASAADVEAVAYLERKLSGGKERRFTLTAAPAITRIEKGASAAEQERFAAVAMMRALFKKRVVLFTSEGGGTARINGVALSSRPDLLFMNAGTKRPVMSVLGHELLHQMRRDKPELYDRLAERLDALIKDPGEHFREIAKTYNNAALTVPSAQTVREELVADIVGDNFTDPAFWRGLQEGRPGLFQRVLGAVRDFLNGVLERLRNERPYGTDKYLSDVMAARDAVVQAMKEYSSSQASSQATSQSAATAPAGNDASLSVDRHTPEQREALARAGIDTRSRLRRAGDKVREFYGRAVEAWKDNWGRQFQQGYLDQFTGISQAVERELGGLPVDQDPYVAARLANGGASSVMRGLLLHGQAAWADNGQHLVKIPGTRGLLDILAPLGEDLNDFFGWMIGNRAARLAKEGRERNLTPAQIQTLQDLAKGKEAKFRAAALEYAAFKRSVLDIAEHAGLIDGEARKVWDNADYIPFYRKIDQEAVFSPTGRKGLAGQSSGIRTLKGGESALNDPMENIIMNFSRLIDASLKNRAIAKTVHLLEQAGSDVVTREGMTFSKELVPAGQVKKVLRDAGTPDVVMDIIPDTAFAGMAKMWAMQPPADPDIVRVMVDGHPRYYRVNDPLLLKALTSFVPFDFPGLGVLRAFKRFLTAGVTAAPPFWIRNFVRDTAAAQLVGRDGFSPGKSVSGIVKSYTETGAGEAMLFAGASFQSGQVNAGDPAGTGAAIRRALRRRGFNAATVEGFMGTVIDTPARWWEHYRHVGEAVENANREAVYEAAAKAGKGGTAAAYEAKDLMDFTLRGSSPVYQFMADVLPFFNARVQGLYRLGRANPKRLAAYGMLMVAASLALAWANADNPEYEELPDWDKDNYWHFWIRGEHFRLPKPFELGVAFATVPERIMRYIRGQDTGKKAATRIAHDIIDQLAFDPVPQAIRPGLNVAMNRDTFRDRPIESMSDAKKQPAQRYSALTSPAAVKLAQAAEPLVNATGLGPKKLEYLANAYFGTIGAYALGLADLAVAALDNKAPAPARRLDDLPLVRDFYRMDPPRATVFEQDLYALRTDVEEIYETVRDKAKKGDKEGAIALAKREATKLALRQQVQSATSMLQDLNRKRDAIYADKKMTPEKKREEIDKILAQKALISHKVMTNPVVRSTQ